MLCLPNIYLSYLLPQAIECDAIVPSVAVLTAVDNCGTVTVSSSEVKTNGACRNTYSLTRTWMASDCSGNTASATQVISVQDTRPPVFLDATPADVVSLRLRDHQLSSPYSLPHHSATSCLPHVYVITSCQFTLFPLPILSTSPFLSC